MESDSKVKFKYVFSDDYNPTYSSGAFGGVTPAGEIAISFYLERHALPLTQTYQVKADGSLGQELAREPEGHEELMIRYISGGVVMSLKSALEFHEWLTEELKRAVAVDARIREHLNVKFGKEFIQGGE